MKESKQPESFLKFAEPWDKNSNSIWLASTLKLFRNIAKFKFPGKLDLPARKQCVSLLQKNLKDSSFLTAPSLYKAESLSPLEKEFLYEHYLTTDTFIHAHHKGEGFVLDGTGTFLATLNIQDHLTLQLTDCKGELENSLDKLVKIETSLGDSIDYAFNPKFGFLTANPYHCGTGLLTRIHLHVPGLILDDQVEALLKPYKEEGIVSSGMQGEKGELIGDILTLYNNYTLGLTAEDIIRLLHTVATKCIVAEKACRTRFKSENSASVRDKISRAFGLLLHSYRLETKEALQALSLCKLGVDLGWISGTSHKSINKLYFHCRRAHLQQQFKDLAENEDLPIKRAEFMKSALKRAKLITASTSEN